MIIFRVGGTGAAVELRQSKSVFLFDELKTPTNEFNARKIRNSELIEGYRMLENFAKNRIFGHIFVREIQFRHPHELMHPPRGGCLALSHNTSKDPNYAPWSTQRPVCHRRFARRARDLRDLQTRNAVDTEGDRQGAIVQVTGASSAIAHQHGVRSLGEETGS